MNKDNAQFIIILRIVHCALDLFIKNKNKSFTNLYYKHCRKRYINI